MPRRAVVLTPFEKQVQKYMKNGEYEGPPILVNKETGRLKRVSKVHVNRILKAATVTQRRAR